MNILSDRNRNSSTASSSVVSSFYWHSADDTLHCIEDRNCLAALVCETSKPLQNGYDYDYIFRLILEKIYRLHYMKM